jgi:hypothetical protein
VRRYSGRPVKGQNSPGGPACRTQEEGVGLEPTTEWIPLLVFRTRSSSSRAPSMKTVGGEGRIRTGVGFLGLNALAGRRNKPSLPPHQSGAGRNRTSSAGFGDQLVAMTLNPINTHTNAGRRTRTSEAPKGRSFTGCRNCRYAIPAREKKGNIKLSKKRDKIRMDLLTLL